MKSVLVRVAVGLLGVVLALASLELVFQLLPTRQQPFNFQAERPAFYYLPHTPLTMQGNEPGRERAANEFRIAVVGDSFTFAPGMQYVDAFPKRLEAMLNTASKVSVFSFGNPGTSTVNQLSAFTDALSYNPNIILLQVTLNDPQLRPLQKEPAEVRGVFGPYQPAGWLTQNSRFFGWVGSRLHNNRSVSSYIAYHRHLWEQNWERFAQPITQMQELAAQANVGFGVVLFPLFDFPLNDSQYPFLEIHRKVRGFTKQSTIEFLDLLPAYEKLDPYRLQLIPGRDTHPNEIAHRIAAEKIYWWLRRQPFFPADRKLKRIYPQRNNVREQQFPKTARR